MSIKSLQGRRHNLVNIQFIYIKFIGTIAEGMLNLQI